MDIKRMQTWIKGTDLEEYVIIPGELQEANDNQPGSQALLVELLKELDEALNTRKELLSADVVDMKVLDTLDYDIHMLKESRGFLLAEFTTIKR